MKNFRDAQVGDVVVRLLAGTIRMPLKVTEITETEIICGDWIFDKMTGFEIDDAFPGIIVSFLDREIQTSGDLQT